MKFLIIHNEYSRRGGEESVVELQKRLLESHGHTVVEYRRKHGEVGKFRSFFTARRNSQAVRDIKKLVADERPDVAIVHNLFPVISGAILPVLRKKGVKILMVLHNYRLVCPNGLFYTHGRVCEQCGDSPLGTLHCVMNRCEGSLLGSVAWASRNSYVNYRRFFHNVDKFLPLSEFQSEKIQYYSGIESSKFEVIPNCIDIASMPRSGVERGDFVGFVGRLSREKGVDLLFETARLLPDVKFRVAGEKADKFESSELPANVELVGFLNKQELADFYSSARAIVLTSVWYEGFPMTVLEAMFYRATVIVPNWAALPEIVDNGECGVLYEPKNAKDLAAKIMEKHSTGDAAHEKVVEKYNSEQYYANILRCV